MSPDTAQTPPRFLTHRAVVERTALSRTSLWRRVAAGDFPQPIRLGTQRLVWLESDVNAWIARLAEARRA